MIIPLKEFLLPQIFLFFELLLVFKLLLPRFLSLVFNFNRFGRGSHLLHLLEVSHRRRLFLYFAELTALPLLPVIEVIHVLLHVRVVHEAWLVELKLFLGFNLASAIFPVNDILNGDLVDNAVLDRQVLHSLRLHFFVDNFDNLPMIGVKSVVARHIHDLALEFFGRVLCVRRREQQ